MTQVPTTLTATGHAQSLLGRLKAVRRLPGSRAPTAQYRGLEFRPNPRLCPFSWQAASGSSAATNGWASSLGCPLLDAAFNREHIQ